MNILQYQKANGLDLLYWQGSRDAEVDFLISTENDGIIPIEVKSGRSTIHSSLDKLMKKYENRIDKAYVIHSKDLRFDGKITYLPIYMMQFIDFTEE